MGSPIASGSRWFARVAGTALVVLILMIGIGEGLPNVFTLPLIKVGELLSIATLIVGILLGWRYELAGGTISLAGLCILIILLLSDTTGVGNTRLNWFYVAMALPGALYVTSALLRRAERPQ